ncbi:MAG: bifunctional 2-polyprenyl-6-hydroxyphenol methylase/3-demethylubiquinol 3-O-methyltransferase UbiG [Xanthomonadales bacterium]|nr:bifunctional 2-polyprenyl-6-hydroxyphenol methylase/3-demethylubiquinol 3-O-methyltransferase UbiG [Gammaproteobacteria bacterium]MBT8055020.1 bifunctional 2-polyprenyl-6-hydroxyphenol methylase/3-demethylubiquinol 3-O-methyltransferase UbiG [Gammaproteobacteria bacterium]NND56402.1 bifunctional 2-polyprenyl-6-hydroxyphenol methylase/3-demethylubiquinol 3-O-methyltransferase UbiG [Xanthomonadales bacterium]NNK50459.1 bifunctional 2-polyprenyl-6-hydroxyphenol methylase/3-demethylubiquinol 3-O-
MQNIDNTERDKFDAIASGWWDPEGPFRPLHELNPARLKFVAERAGLADALVLDVGCGGGILAESLARKGALVTAIDVAPRVLATAKLHLHESGLDVNYQEITVEDQAKASPEAFDVVTCMEMLEHVPDPASIIRSIHDLLKPGGHGFFSTLNRTPLAFALGIVGAEHIARLLPRGTHRYDRFIRPSELSAWLREAGMVVRDIVGLHYNPVTRSVMLGGNVKVNYLVHASKPAE